jgi:excisionase family DNA binding protein
VTARIKGTTATSRKTRKSLFGMERETGFEPATLSLGKRIDAFVGSCRYSQPLADTSDSAPTDFHSVAFGARVCSPFAAPVLQALLTVREVATQLGVSTATVYKLCATRQLSYVRVLGAMRIAPADVAAFIARLRHLTT